MLREAGEQELLSEEHFTVDGTLLEAWASQKSFQRKDAPEGPPPEDPGNPTVDFHKEKRTNETHQSTTDPDARLARKGKGKEAKLSYAGHVLMENRNGLVVNVKPLLYAGIRPPWCSSCGNGRPRRTWRRTRNGGAVPSTAGPHGTRVEEAQLFIEASHNCYGRMLTPVSS